LLGQHPSPSNISIALTQLSFQHQPPNSSFLANDYIDSSYDKGIVAGTLAIMTPEEDRAAALNSYRAKLIESREWEAKLKNLRLEIKDMQREYDRTEDNIKALQSVGQIIGEVLKQLDDERCKATLG
jgi:hypothetical protein